MSKVLIVIDAQNDFITGELGSKEAIAAVPNIVEKINNLHNDDFIIYTKDSHYDDYLEVLEGKYLPIKHCIMGTLGWNLHPDIRKAITDFGERAAAETMAWPVKEIDKETFGSIDLIKTIKDYDCFNIDIDEYEICGFCTDICVISNALILKTNPFGIPVKLDSKCCAGSIPELHEAALNVMRACQVEVY